MSRQVTRRDFLASGLVALGASVVGPAVWRGALAAPVVSAGPYGPLLPADRNGIMLPKGFVSRVIARSGRPVAGTDYVWHRAPDGGATFPTSGDGWIYVSNSELGGGGGGVGAIRFDSSARIVDAYPVAKGTSRNCAGGPTPWGTWLTCEEVDTGLVWECDPRGRREKRALPAMGKFTHEAAAVDPAHRHVYLTEDAPDGRFYRFVPSEWPSLVRGRLEVASVAPDGATKWLRVPDPSASRLPTRRQVAGSTRFIGGEGTWFDAGVVYFTTKGDNRVWAYDTRSSKMSLLYDGGSLRGTPLSGVDNITGSKYSGDLFVAEDGGDLEIVMITPDQQVARLLRVAGSAHNGSEIAGPALDPSGRRLYFSSQRGYGDGITYEVRGPFRRTRVGGASATASPSTASPAPSTTAPTTSTSTPPATVPPGESPSLLPLATDEDGGLPLWGIGGVGAALAGAFAVIGRRLRAGGARSDD